MDEMKKGMSLEELAGANSEIKEVKTSDVSKEMIAKYGESEKPVVYDDPIHEAVMKFGKPMSDELFEQAKSIIENKKLELELEGKLKGQENYDGPDEEVLDSVDSFSNEEPHEFDNIPANVEDDISSKVVKFKEYEEEEFDATIDEVIEDLEDEFGEDVDQDELMNIVKTKVREKIKPVTEKIDMSTFTISNKPISVIKAFENSSFMTETKVSDWVLINTGIPFSMKEMSGYDIERLNPQYSRRSEYNTYMNIYSIIYAHIINDNKPSLEEFLKLVKFSDVKHIYFNIYRSSFGESNVLTYSCEKQGCNEIFVEDVDIDDMYRFANDKIKEEFEKILNNNEAGFTHVEYESTLLQISDEYMIGIKEPSIYNIIFETASLDDAFKEKYRDILSIISYIDNIYFIDKNSKQLQPISIKTYPDSLAKTVKYKILQYAKVISILSSDQYYNLTSAISNIIGDEDIEYFIPEQSCPKCKAKIEEVKVSPESMLFTRHQLGALANI